MHYGNISCGVCIYIYIYIFLILMIYSYLHCDCIVHCALCIVNVCTSDTAHCYVLHYYSTTSTEAHCASQSPPLALTLLALLVLVSTQHDIPAHINEDEY